ncbi:MAG: hypothetical protein ACP5PZ_11620 [Bacteroidales bacterium]
MVLSRQRPCKSTILLLKDDVIQRHGLRLYDDNVCIDLKLRKERYDRAIAWLKDVQAGIVQPDLPPLQDISINTGLISYGSNEKNIYEW